MIGLKGPRWSRGRASGSRVLGGARGRPTGFKGVRGWAYRVPGGQGIGLQGPRESSDRPTRSQVVKGQALSVPGGQGFSRVRTLQ